ncbi:unnamed protein product [Caenorhabditis angaria]|uniref:Globin domain-containing protein n=1 Tax=Caenorhabditis angaria TaxID=860376 RepID=A0A9P1IYQ2_9PELO|nr:unnamed protein product [Caenorhabditis angaria]
MFQDERISRTFPTIPPLQLQLDQNCMSVSNTSAHQLFAPRPLRRCRSASPVPPLRPPIMSTERQNLLKKSWSRIPRQQFGKSVLQAFIQSSGIDRSLFVDTDTEQRHIKHFIDLVHSCIENLSDLETALKPWLDTIGRGHVGFKITAKHWEKFGESVLSTMSEWIGPGRNHKETIKAWMVLSSFLADRLSAASRIAAHSPMLTPRVQLLTGKSQFEWN